MPFSPFLILVLSSQWKHGSQVHSEPWYSFIDEYLDYYSSVFFFCLIFKNILFIYFQREGKGRRKRGRETSMCGCLSCAPYWGPGPGPKHVPWLGIKLQPFGSRAGTQSAELHQPQLPVFFNKSICECDLMLVELNQDFSRGWHYIPKET